MPSFSIAESFIESATRLDAADIKRVTAFLDRLLQEPERMGSRSEIVHDAADRSIRSIRVTKDLRAITHVDGDRMLLLFVGRHDVAYEWVRNRCVSCHPVTREVQVVTEPDAAERRLRERVAASEAERIAVGGAPAPPLFDGLSDDYLVSLGVPVTWLPALRLVRTDDMLLAIAGDLPAVVADRLVRLATGEFVAPPVPYATEDEWWAARAAARVRAEWDG